MLVMFALVALELFFAQYLQLVLGLGPLEASLRLVPLLAATVVGALGASKVIERYGSPRVMGVGLLASGLSLLPVFALGVRDEYWYLAISFVVLGMALEAALVAANDLILSAATVDEASQAASIEETAYELGGGVGVAVLGAVGAATFTAAMPAGAGPSGVAGVSTAEAAEAARSISDAVRVAADLPSVAGDPLLAAARDAFVASLHAATAVAFVIVMVCAVAAIAVARKAPGPA
jgi:DHA2 family multidrug resistance protein-like MFS transporter